MIVYTLLVSMFHVHVHLSTCFSRGVSSETVVIPEEPKKEEKTTETKNGVLPLSKKSFA